MRKLIFIAALALAGCQSEGERADRQIEAPYYEAGISGASPDVLCSRAFEVSLAYKSSGNSKQSEQWDSKASAHCIVASLERQNLMTR
jgi:hypothetical protein